MTARAIGDVLAGRARDASSRRTFQPVRRDSRHVGEREERIWRALGTTKREAFRFRDALLQAARYFDERNKEAGKGNGPLGLAGVRVLEELLAIVDFKTGRLEPAIDTICRRISKSRATVVRALARLKAHGFLDWVRRTEPTENAGEAGPQVRQITNAYGFDITRLPKMALAWMRKKMSDGPPPDCEAARRDADRAEVDAMLATVSAEDQARFIADGTLGDALARLGRALDKSASLESGQSPGVKG